MCAAASALHPCDGGRIADLTLYNELPSCRWRSGMAPEPNGTRYRMLTIGPLHDLRRTPGGPGAKRGGSAAS